MFLRKPACPVDYRMCNQTVTVYRAEAGKYTRTVYKRAFLEFRKTQTVEKTGSKEANSFLLVIPGSKQAVFIGDRVLLGDGPEITSREEWSAFIPSKVSGLVVVTYVDPKYWNSEIVHTEAGG